MTEISHRKIENVLTLETLVWRTNTFSLRFPQGKVLFLLENKNFLKEKC
jgi:hypothetical protein